MPRRTLDDYIKQIQATTKQIIRNRENITKFRIIGFYKETRFKETPIGKVPEDWKIVKLEEIARIVNGYTFPLDLQGKKSGKYPFIKVGDMNNAYKYIDKADNYIDEEDLKKLKARVFPKGTIIFPKIGMAMRLNKFRILGREALFDNNIAGVIVNNNVYNEFLYYYFQGKINLISLAGATTVPSITKSRLKKILVSLPPLEEQWGIVEVLSSVDRAIEETDRFLEKLKRVKRALMQELLTKGIGHKEFKETSIGKIPKEWNIVKLSKIFKEVDKTLRRVKIEDTKSYKLVTVKLYGKGVVLRDIKLGKDIKTKNMFIVKAGDFIFSKIDARNGAYGFVPQELDGAVVSSDFPILELDRRKAIDAYVYYYMSQPHIWELIRARARGTTNRRRVKVSEFLSIIDIALPPLDEQRKIADTLSSIDAWLKFESKRKEKLERLKRGLMDLLLTGKVRVRVAKVG